MKRRDLENRLILESSLSLFGPTLFGFPGRNRVVGLDDDWSSVSAVRTPVHCSSVSSHPENNILRMALWAEPLRNIVHAHILPIRWAGESHNVEPRRY